MATPNHNKSSEMLEIEIVGLVKQLVDKRGSKNTEDFLTELSTCVNNGTSYTTILRNAGDVRLKHE